MSEIRTRLEVSGDIASNGTIWSQNESCHTGIHAYTKAEVNAALALKAPLASPALTGTATASNLTVSGNLLAGTTNVLTALGEKATTTALDLKAPLASPALTGTTTAANLTVATNLLIGTTNVLTSLNSKANTTDTYTKTQVANLFQPLISSFGSPLRCDVNILSGLSTLSIEETAILTIGDIESSGTLSIDTIEAKISDHIQVNNNLTVAGNVRTNGNLDVDGVINCGDIKGLNRPYIGLLINANGTIASNVGQVPNSSIAVTIAGTNAYTITFTTTPHPLGEAYLAFATPKTTASTTPVVGATCTQTATSITVWNRTYLNSNIAYSFYVFSVP
jgi:hypothetical protein